MVTFQSSQQDAVKQKDELKKEISFIRIELQQVRDDRDHLLAQVQSLAMEVAEYKEISGKSSKSLETITAKAAVLEVCTPITLTSLFCYSQV